MRFLHFRESRVTTEGVPEANTMRRVGSLSHIHAGANTATKRLFPVPGGTFMRKFSGEASSVS